MRRADRMGGMDVYTLLCVVFNFYPQFISLGSTVTMPIINIKVSEIFLNLSCGI